MYYAKHDNQTDISKGLQIDDPMIFLSWDVDEKHVRNYFPNYPLLRVADGYYVLEKARLFETLTCNIGLHFEQRLKRIEFFRDDYKDLKKSYDDFQALFELKFGKPSTQSTTSTNFDSYEWNFADKIKICHYVMNRFGLEEHLNIERA